MLNAIVISKGYTGSLNLTGLVDVDILKSTQYIEGRVTVTVLAVIFLVDVTMEIYINKKI